MVTGTHCHSLKLTKADYGNACAAWLKCDGVGVIQPLLQHEKIPNSKIKVGQHVNE